MAKSYTSTLLVKCWKQHTCAGCGSEYSYLLQRKAVGSGRSPEKARINMHKKVVFITEHDTDMHPCPGCGLYQYDMIGQRRGKSRIQFFWVAVVSFVTLLILRGTDAVQANTLVWIGAAIAGFVVAAHWLLETSNSNRDLAANQALGQQRVTDGKLRHGAIGAESKAEQLARPPRTALHVLALLLLLVACCMIVLPEVMRSAKGWPLNSACYPPVVGTADTTRVYMPQSITSIKSYWRGSPTVTLHYSGGPTGGVEAAASTNQNTWGSTISVKSEEKSNTSHPWVKLTLPDDPSLVGKTITASIVLSLEYPQMTDGSNYTTIEDELSHSVNIQVAPRGAGEQYNNLWWIGVAGGGGVVLIASLMLYYQAKALSKRANRTQVFAAD